MSWQYFKRGEFACHCGCETNGIKAKTIDLCDEFRERMGIPLGVVSGYRCPNHPIEANKPHPGKHSEGLAADLRMENGIYLRQAVEIALEMNIPGVGVGQRYIHIDLRDGTPVMWGYSGNTQT